MNRNDRLSHQHEEVTAQTLKDAKLDASKARSHFKGFRICSRKFGYVVLLGGLLAIQDFTFEYGVMTYRKAAFNDEFMKQNFESYHK